jgi:diguanylate cyclase (GGDEF)-like protein
MVASLYGHLGSDVILGILQVTVCAFAAGCLADVILMELVFLGVVAVVARVGVVLCYRYACPADADRKTLEAWETRYLVAGAAGAAVLGASGVRIVLSQDATAELLWSAGLFSIVLDVVGRVSGRRWTSLYPLGFATIPPFLAFATRNDWVHLTYAGVLAVNVVIGLGIIVSNARVRAQLMQDTRSFALQANADPLTRLSNRLSLNRFLEQTLAAMESEPSVAVHCLDLDRFKEANDRYGHAVGDAILESFATRIRMSLRLGDMLARVGGDEFVIVQCGLRKEIDAANQAQRVIDLMKEPFDIQGHRISIGVSIGIAIASTMTVSPQELLAQADGALYRTKRRGRNDFSIAKNEAPYQSNVTVLSSAA